MSGCPAQSVRPAPAVLRARAIDGRTSAAVESGNGFLLEQRRGPDSSRRACPRQRRPGHPAFARRRKAAVLIRFRQAAEQKRPLAFFDPSKKTRSLLSCHCRSTRGGSDMALTGKIALVAGATRGAGRGIAVQLGAAGATVYVTGRSTKAGRSELNRPETIEETAAL